MIAKYSPDKCEEVRSLQRKYEEEEERIERRVKELAEKLKLNKRRNETEEETQIKRRRKEVGQPPTIR